MKVTKSDNGYKVVSFNSLGEFSDYITTTPTNAAFVGAEHESESGSESFTQTASFDEAMKLFREGWSVEAQDLVVKLAEAEKKAQAQSVNRRCYDVAGGFVSVPRYIQGKPNCMIRMKKQQIKQRVIDVYKSVVYAANTPSEKIIEESIKAMQIIKRLESMGYRVNLYVAHGIHTYRDTYKTIAVVKLKDASEKLNISKLAFPLAHPSMLRRLMFRFTEVSPYTNSRKFNWNYGYVASDRNMRDSLCDSAGSYFLPSFIYCDTAKISSLDDLEDFGGNFAK